MDIEINAWSPLFINLQINLILHWYQGKCINCNERGKAGGLKPQHFPLPCLISSFLFSCSQEPQPYGGFSMPQHLSLPAVITFLNDKLRATKQQFLKILFHFAKDDTFKKFPKFIKDHWIVCSVYKLLYILHRKFDIIYALWGPRQILWGRLKSKKRWKLSQN